MSVTTGRWSEISAVHDVRCTGEVSFLVITIFKALRVVKGLYGLMIGLSGSKIRQEFPSA